MLSNILTNLPLASVYTIDSTWAGVMVIVVLALVVAAGAVGWVVFMNEDSPQDPQPPSP